MPWSMSEPPPGTGKLTSRQLRVCIEAANGVMKNPHEGEPQGDLEGRAMQACWAAARNAGYRKEKRGSPKKGVVEDIAMDEKEQVEKATWSAAAINLLPDMAFALVKSGGKKDDEGKTVPRSLRHLPHHNANVKSATEDGSVDLPHLRNALAREPQMKGLSEADHTKARNHLTAHAKALLPSYAKMWGGRKVSYGDIERQFYQQVEQVPQVAEPGPEGMAYEAERPRWLIADIYADWILIRGKATDDIEDGLYKLPYSIAGQAITFAWDAMQQMLIDLTPKGAASALFSMKGADDVWRWVAVSGSAFEDKDKEIISRKSLQSAIEYADMTGAHGTLDIYHMPGTDVGLCEASALAGNFLVEAGRWFDTEMAVAARTWADKNPALAGMSILFQYDPTEKKDGVYTGDIRIARRSLLKREHAACPWTMLDVVANEEENKMSKADVAEIVGEAAADAIFERAEKDTKTLVEEGVAFKEKEQPAEVVEEQAVEKDSPVLVAVQEQVPESVGVPVLEVTDEVIARIAIALVPHLQEALGKQVVPLQEKMLNLETQVAQLATNVEGLAISKEDLVAKALAELPKATVRLALGGGARLTEKLAALPAVRLADPHAEEKQQKLQVQRPGGSGLFSVTLQESIEATRRARESQDAQ